MVTDGFKSFRKAAARPKIRDPDPVSFAALLCSANEIAS
jgi:hypothetical protein